LELRGKPRNHMADYCPSGRKTLYCLTLLLMRLAVPIRYRNRGGLLPRLFTLTHLSPFGLRRAVCFLWRCLLTVPQGAVTRSLTGIIPEGARTFLGMANPYGIAMPRFPLLSANYSS